MPSTSAPRAPSSAVEVASGTGRARASAAGGGEQLRRTPGGAGRARRPCRGGAAPRSRPTRRTARPRRRTASSARRRSRSSARRARRSPRCPRASRAASPGARRRSPVVPTTAWMPWSMQNSRLSITTSGWVKSTTASAPASTRLLQLVVGVDARDELQVVGGLDRRAHLRADLAQRPEHTHLESHGPQASRRRASGRPDLGQRLGRVKSSSARACTSSTETASMRRAPRRPTADAAGRGRPRRGGSSGSRCPRG